jgi:hypothetical protein
MATLMKKPQVREYDMVMIDGVMANVGDQLKAIYHNVWRIGEIKKIVSQGGRERLLVDTQKGHRWFFKSELSRVEIRSNLMVDD